MLEKIVLLNCESYIIFLFFSLMIKYILNLNKKLYIGNYINLIFCIFILTLYIYYFNPILNWYVFDYLLLVEYLSYFFRLIILLISCFFFFIGIKKKKLFINLDIIFLLFLSCIIFFFSLMIFDLFLLFLIIELISLIFYIISFGKGNSIKSNEAGLKYFILGVISSLFLLYGLSFLYGFFGSLNLSKLLILVNLNIDIIESNLFFLIFAVSFILSAFFFKLGIVPFHMWLVDIYVGIPIIIFIYFSLYSKILFIVLMFKLLIIFIKLLGNIIYLIFFFCGFISIIVGIIGMLSSFTLKRFFVYSSISHMGFILINFSINTIFGYIMGFIYLTIYILLMLGIFILTFFIDLNKIGFELIFDLKKLMNISLILTFYISLILLSFAGIPPFIGFWIKWLTLVNLFYINDIFGIFFCLLILLINILGIYGYIRLIAYIFFENTNFSLIKINNEIIINGIILSVSLINLIGGFFMNDFILFYLKLILNFLLCYI